MSSTALRAAAAALTLTAASTASLAADVGVSVHIAQPGVYGRIDIGNVPPPVVYAQPIVVAPSPVAVHQRPIYLYVPEAQQREWPRWCSRYSACGQPVYFVPERWVVERYRSDHPGWQAGPKGHPHGMPPGQAKKMHGGGKGPGHGHGRGHGKRD